MTQPATHTTGADITLERIIKASPSTVWRCVTEAEHLKEWMAPRPWKVIRCDVDLRPVGTPGFVPFFSAVITLAPEGKWTKYRVRVVHADDAGRAQHEELGFFDGWSTVLTQMSERAESLER